MGTLGRTIAQLGRKFAASARARILFWAAFAALVCGVLGIAEPIDQYLHSARDLIRAHPSDGSIVVVEVNSRTRSEVDALGAQRSVDAAALERLFDLGARRVFFDKVYSDPTSAAGDAAFERALKRHRGRIILATRFEADHRTGAHHPLLPLLKFAPLVELGSINVWRDAFGFTSRVPFQSLIGDRLYPSFSSLMANKQIASSGTFSPDFSIRYNTIPTVNLLDVLHATSAARVVRGRDVIVAQTADSMGDTHQVAAQGPMPGVYIHVIGAETLKQGLPIAAGWLLPAILVLLISSWYLSCRSKRSRILLACGTGACLLTGGLLCDALRVETEVMPAALLLGIVLVRARILNRAVTNPLTGLPTLYSILRDGGTSPLTLVGVRIGNYADLRAMLSDAEERQMLAEIVRRLRVGSDPTELMHAGDSFVWKTTLKAGTALFDHLEGLHALLTSPLSVGGRLVDLSAGFGIEEQTDRPLTNRVGSLQVSMEQAVKSSAKWRLYDSRQLEDADFRLSLLSRLDLALANGEIWVAYQPKLDLRSKRVAGAEALVRWSHPERGLISPDRFIPVAEQANRIAGLTLFVLESAIRDAKRLEHVDPEFSVAVNLSVRMLAQPDLPDDVAALLAKHQLAPGRLTLEITESEEIDPSGDLQTLHSLRALGVHLSIDDYGTKFSTLDYIRQLPASEIKIDQRFIGSIHTDQNAWIMARSTVELAHSLGLTVVAEGVELPETATALVEMGCDLAQGYLIARPIRFDELKRFLSATKLRRVA